MHQGQPSRTAEEVAGPGQRDNLLDVPPVYDDSLAMRVIDPSTQDLLRNDRLKLDPQVRAFISMRSRFAEDELARAVQAGVRQYVILGAGLDTFAYQNLYEHLGLRVFEVDHPSTQEWKRQRLQTAGIAIPESMKFAPTDFRNQSLADVLPTTGFKANEPAYFSMLGLVIFLPKELLTILFQFVAALPPRSGMVFDYGMLATSLTPAQRAVRERAARNSARVGEPFITFFDPTALEAELRQLGFTHIDDFGYEEANQRYFSGRTDGLHLGSSARRVVGASL